MVNNKVVGIFTTEEEAIRAIDRLKIDGYTDSEISVVAKERETLERISDNTQVDIDTTDSTDGTMGGVLAGGTIGGAAALLVELGVIAIPGIGPFLAAGPIAAALTGAVAGGAVGGLVGALIDMGLTKEEAKEYNEYLERGDILVMVDEYNERYPYDTFYENNSIIRDRYDRNKFRDSNFRGNNPNRPDLDDPNNYL